MSSRDPGPNIGSTPPAPPVVFIHIPKTAGTAVTNYFASQCGGTGDLPPPFVGDYSIYAGESSRYPFIAGHFAYWKMRAVVPHGQFVTFLRHPIERAISLYRSWKDPSNLTDHWRKVMDPERLRLFEWIHRSSLEEVVKSGHPFVVGEMSNCLTEYLSTDGSADRESAFTNLRDRFVAFGLQEEFARSLAWFRKVVAWLGPYRLPTAQENRARIPREPVSDTVIRCLERLTEVDLELYEAASRLFAERTKTVVDESDAAHEPGKACR